MWCAPHKSLKSRCPGAELNHRHTDFQSVALPTELPGRSASGAYRGTAVILSSRALLGRPLARGLFNLAAGAITLLAAATADAQTDEIQVYDAEINNPGVFSVQLHNNYTPIGRKQPGFEGGIAPNHTLNGVPEWALGVTEWLEIGASATGYPRAGAGCRWRAEFVVPHAAERSFFYGVNLELGFTARYWEPPRTSGEIRPIIGG